MPLDDIFHEKSIKLDAENLKIFWQRCAIIMGLIVWLFLITPGLTRSGYIGVLDMIGILLGVIIIPSHLSFFLSIFASYIPFSGFSQGQRESIYFYISITIMLLLYLLSWIDELYNNSSVYDWFCSIFLG